MSHHCHATACAATVPPAMFMCRRHWFSLPATMQSAIWATYRHGQENDKQPSAAYCRAAKAAVEWVAAREGVVADVQMYDVFLAALESDAT
jgi:hypothetical protein